MEPPLSDDKGKLKIVMGMPHSGKSYYLREQHLSNLLKDKFSLLLLNESPQYLK